MTAGAAGGRAARAAPWGAAAAVLAVLALTAGAAMPVGVFYDDGIYVDLARALASGAGYHHLALPGAPAGIHYPPLYPAWLALWNALRPPVGAAGVIAWLKGGNALLAAASVVPWARWGARRLAMPAWLAAVAAAVAVLLVPARAVTSTLFSEPLAWFLLGCALDLADEGEQAPAPSLRRAVAMAALAALLPLLRTILLPVTAAVGWRLASETARPVALRQREAMFAAFLMLPTVAWFAWTARHAHDIPVAWMGSYGSYLAMWRESVSGPGDLAALAGHQVMGLWRTARQLWGSAGAVAGLAAIAAGLWRLRGWRSVAWLGTLGYFAIVLVWPIEPDRFLWGVLPLLALLMAGGIMAGCGWVRGRHPARLAVLVLIAALPLYSCTRLNAHGYRARGWIVPQERETAAYAPVVAWAATLPRDAVILTANDPLVAQATGLRAAPLLAPDLRETRGAPPLRPAPVRAAMSACAAGAGWMVVIDTLDEAGAAIAALRADTTTGIRFGETVHLDGARAAVQFRCAPTR